MLGHLNYTLRRLESFITQIDHVLNSEIPYLHSKEALNRIRALFVTKVEYLRRLEPDSDPDSVLENCGKAVESLFAYVPLLGFLLRSTNVRNAFEIYRPLLRLAYDVLEPGVAADSHRTRIILSSEWAYAPFIQETLELPNFFLIGFPATESDNPLIVPLAGHELGHTLWRKRDLKRYFSGKVAKAIRQAVKQRSSEFLELFPSTPADIDDNTLVFLGLMFPAQNYALNQAKETFCDFIGLLLFGQSFLHAFAYLLSPRGVGVRSPFYPSIAQRVNNLVCAAGEFSVTVPSGYEKTFGSDIESDGAEKDKFLIHIADEVVKAVIPDIISEVSKVRTGSAAHPWSSSEEDRILECYKRIMPAEDCVSIADILNAAWRAVHDVSFWADDPQVSERKSEVLKDLVLKNFEVFEIEQVTGAR